jgi:uncharacterized membrane protein YfcA
VTLLDHLLLVLAAAAGGVLNSVAGGGSFLTFPSLLIVGIPAVAANATSAVALWPGSLAGAIAYRDELAESHRLLLRLAAASVAGGISGAVLLLRTSNSTFLHVLPYLLLAAALVFTFGARVTNRLRNPSTALGPVGVPATPTINVGIVLVQYLIALYGGYFGGGMGIVMLAAFSALGMTNIHAMNALKTTLATLINLVAIVAFIAAGAIAWRPGIIMVTAATLGGYFGARAARRVPATLVKRFVLCVAWTMTAYFFWKTYAA